MIARLWRWLVDGSALGDQADEAAYCREVEGPRYWQREYARRPTQLEIGGKYYEVCGQHYWWGALSPRFNPPPARQYALACPSCGKPDAPSVSGSAREECGCPYEVRRANQSAREAKR